MNRLLAVLFIALAQVVLAAESSMPDGAKAYAAGDYAAAKTAFEQAIFIRPSSGLYQNLGNAEWQLGRPGAAILAWERALWLNPYDANAQNNLRFARDAAQLESPELRWYEAGSNWLPRNFWAGLTTVSLWLVAAALVLPTVFRWQRGSWQQGLAALGLGIFLLSLPANYGVGTRSRIGFVIDKNVSLRRTPTAEAEPVTQLAAGEPGRLIRERGQYLYIQTGRKAGWVERGQFELISPK